VRQREVGEEGHLLELFSPVDREARARDLHPAVNASDGGDLQRVELRHEEEHGLAPHSAAVGLPLVPVAEQASQAVKDRLTPLSAQGPQHQAEGDGLSRPSDGVPEGGEG
jgi:hypothetical protein